MFWPVNLFIKSTIRLHSLEIKIKNCTFKWQTNALDCVLESINIRLELTIYDTIDKYAFIVPCTLFLFTFIIY